MDGLWSSSDDPCSQNGSSQDGRSHLRMARVLLSSRPRMAGEPDLKQGGGDVHLYIKMAVIAAQEQIPGRSLVVQVVQVSQVHSRDTTV